MAKGSEYCRLVPEILVLTLLHSLVPLSHHAVMVNVEWWRMWFNDNTASRLQRIEIKRSKAVMTLLYSLLQHFETTPCRRMGELKKNHEFFVRVRRAPAHVARPELAEKPGLHCP